MEVWERGKIYTYRYTVTTRMTSDYCHPVGGGVGVGGGGGDGAFSIKLEPVFYVGRKSNNQY